MYQTQLVTHCVTNLSIILLLSELVFVVGEDLAAGLARFVAMGLGAVAEHDVEQDALPGGDVEHFLEVLLVKPSHDATPHTLVGGGKGDVGGEYAAIDMWKMLVLEPASHASGEIGAFLHDDDVGGCLRCPGVHPYRGERLAHLGAFLLVVNHDEVPRLRIASRWRQQGGAGNAVEHFALDALRRECPVALPLRY